MRFAILTKLLFALLALAGEDFTIYQVKYRPPEELIRVASGVLGNRANFSPMGEKILINGDKAVTKAALDLFQELDQKPRTYRVTVASGGKSSDESSAVGGEIDTGNKNVRTQKRSGTGQGLGSGSIQVGGIGINARSSRTDAYSRGGNTVQVLEGGEAKIVTGNSIFPSGMWVRPRPLGKGLVQLELYSKKSKGLEVEAAETTVQVPVGKWTSIGGVDKSGSRTGSEILGGTSGRSGSSTNLQLLVEEVR